MGGGAIGPPQGHPAADRAAEILRRLEGLKTAEPRLAEPMERATARVIDAVAWAVVFFVVNAVGFAVAAALGLVEERPEQAVGAGALTDQMHPAASWATLFAVIAALWVIEVPATARTGRHFAKKRLGLTVVGPGGGPPGLARASLRWGAAWLPSFAAFVLWGATVDSAWSWLFLGLELAALAVPGKMFFDAENRGWHDRLAGTRVLSER